jgi:hypothetical protein
LAAATSDAQRIEHALAEAAEPLSIAAIRAACRIRTQPVTSALGHLVREGRVAKTADGNQLTP